MKRNKKYISLEGWNPDILRGGEIVLCVIRKERENHQLKVGRVVGSVNIFNENGQYVPGVDKDGKEIPNGFYVESLDGKHKYYPSTLDVCLIEEDHNEVSKLIPHLMEIEYL